MGVMNLVIPKTAAKRELLFNKAASEELAWERVCGNCSVKTFYGVINYSLLS
jgi:hypothetical protein